MFRLLFHSRTAPPGAAAEDERKASPERIDPETAKAVAEFAGRIYADEYARTKELDIKVAGAITATGALLLFVLGALTKTPSGLPHGIAHPYLIGMVLCVGLLVVTEYFFLGAFIPRQYSRPRIDSHDDAASVQGAIESFHWQVAVDYEAAVTAHDRQSEAKARSFRRGLCCLGASVVILALLSLPFAFAGGWT